MQKKQVESDPFFTSFADLLALLLVFFIYLSSMSEMKKVEVIQLKKALESSLGIQDSIQKKTDSVVSVQDSLQKGVSSGDVSLESIDQSTVEPKLRLVLEQDFLFQPGKSKLKQSGHQFLGKLAALLKDENIMMIIEGHTDNTPIQTRYFPSNWHLSAYRAAEVLMSLNRNGIPAHHLKLIGYGETVPLLPNTSQKNKNKNRRVVITIKELKSKEAQ